MKTTLAKQISEELGVSIPIIQALGKYAKKLHELYEIQCNGSDREKFRHEAWKDYQDYSNRALDYTNNSVEVLQQKATSLAAENGLNLYHQTDPRGMSIYISREALDSSNYDNGRAVG